MSIANSAGVLPEILADRHGDFSTQMLKGRWLIPRLEIAHLIEDIISGKQLLIVKAEQATIAKDGRAIVEWFFNA